MLPDTADEFNGVMLLYIICGRKMIAAALSAAVLITAAAVASGSIMSESVAASASVSWGLSFPEDGGTPSGSADAASLKNLGAVYTGDTGKKRIYLTFDSGYENGYTAHILDVLKKHNAHGTFFLVGNYIKTSPELVKRMANEGHTVGNHTMTHPDMSALSGEKFCSELQQLESLYKETTGQEMKKFYRPPQGKYSEENLQSAKELGYTTVLWSLAYADWNNDSQPTKDDAFKKLIPRIHSGAIVLLHSTSKTNSEILDELLTRWEELGYSFGDISELTVSDSENSA